jgi:hypothetical protein
MRTRVDIGKEPNLPVVDTAVEFSISQLILAVAAATGRTGDMPDEDE